MPAVQRAQVLFLVRFFGVLAAAYFVIAWNPVNDRVIEPFTAGIARVSGKALQAIGQPVVVNDTVIASSHFAVNINNGCNAVEAMLILLASIVAFPASLKARAAGLVIGAIAIQAVNLVRVVTLFLLGAYHRRLFDTFHTAVWQIVIILFAIGFFLVWSARVGPPRLASRA